MSIWKDRILKLVWRSVFAGLLLAHLGFAADRKQLSAAAAAVDANLKTAAGKQYDEQIGKEFSSKYLSSIKQCKQSAVPGTVAPFDLFLKLDAAGKVLEGLAYPETSFSTCSRTALLAAMFQAPPHGDYWINIHMEFSH